MFAYLRSIKLEPIEWEYAVGLTGEGSPYIGDVLATAFDAAQAVVVLLTPDETVQLDPIFSTGEEDTESKPARQSRPNVLFEAGMALGRHATRTILVEIGEVRPFSAVAGRHAIRLSNDQSARRALVSRLKAAGCELDLADGLWSTAGNFSIEA